MAHAPARMLSGLFGGLPGRRQPVQDLGGRGCRRPHSVANLLVVAFCFLTLVLLTPLFRGMPHPAFAAIVIGATAPAIYDGASRTERARSVG
jgi:hypothetical protein